MPLVDMAASEAVELRKNNPVAGWGSRLTGNRVEPIAKPEFDAPFRFEPGEPIFTIGSCFARNMERELRALGFLTPVLDHLERPGLQDVRAPAINNYGTPSIYNELAWALGERPFVLEDHAVESSDGKFADLHMPTWLRSTSWNVLVRRRQAIQALYRTVTDCRVVIMTLGLVEVWYDTKTQGYVNQTPRPTALKRDPDRFRLHVLSFSETYDYLDRALDLIRRHGRPDVRVILTVSPVAMAATHRAQDVILANSYSKSVLRAAAETAVSEHDFVTYFPSYETCALSDRRYAWAGDLVHVTEDIIRLNVRRLLDRYSTVSSVGDEHEAEIAAGGAPAAVEWARKVRRASLDEAGRFFARYAAFGAEAPEFAIEHAGWLRDSGETASALAIIHAALLQVQEAGDDPLPLVVRKADLLRDLKRPQEAIDLLEPYAAVVRPYGEVWRALLSAAMDMDQSEPVLAILERHLQAVPAQTPARRSEVGRWLHQRGDNAGATRQFESALEYDADHAYTRLLYAEFLVTAGRADEARRQIEGVVPASPTEAHFLRKLTLALAETAPAN
jgi:hypothetical protein